MNHPLLESVSELFKDPASFRPEMMEDLLIQLFKLFNELKIKMASEDGQVRSEAIQTANELRAKLEEQAYRLCQIAEIEPSALEDYMNNSAHFSQEEQEAMNMAKEAFITANEQFKREDV